MSGAYLGGVPKAVRQVSPDPKHVADAELAVLEMLWEHGAATIRELTDRLYPRGTTSHYATVQKLLERLEGKHCVSRDRTGFAHVFRPTIERGDLVGQRLQDVAEKLCDGSLTPLLMHLVRSGRLTVREREMLRKLLEEPPRGKQE